MLHITRRRLAAKLVTNIRQTVDEFGGRVALYDHNGKAHTYKARG